MKTRLNAKTLARTLILVAFAMTMAGCELLGALGGLGVNGLSLLGVQPADNYNSTGNIEVSLLPKSENSVVLGNLQSLGVRAQVRGENGQMNDCDYVGEETELASYFNSVAMLIDDSGSMGRSYEPDVCKTCPHDPQNKRAEAAEELAGIVLDGAPDSNIAVFDFGPDPDADRQAIRVLADFSNNKDSVKQAIQLVDGTQEVGTPLWDALAETIVEINDNAQELEAMSGESTERVNSEAGNPRTDEVKRYRIVLSDGADTMSVNHDLQSVIALAQTNNIPVFAVGLGPAAANAGVDDSNAEMQVSTIQDLQTLAEATGGFYASVKSAAQLRNLYEQVGLAMTEGYQTATYDCDGPGNSPNNNTNEPDPTNPDTTPNTGPRHVQGNLLLGNGLVTLPFGFYEPSN